ncbi:MAG: 5'-nucleotidase C-terminal domain-containing protein [Deltaproteobacteria bacterium]|nr:5'-nucleotidase C-terminal domain-containing protein [Deltaproteobacteria bacterium]
MEPFRSEEEKMVGGAARLATLIDQIRAENSRLGRHTLFLVAGDLFLGTPMSAIFKGEAEVKFLNQTQADVLTLGPHEFDFGREILQERIQQANFAVISANVYKGRERLFPPVVVKNLPGGLRVAILGLITPDSARVVNPSTVPDLIFTDPVAEAKALVPEIKRSSDLLIALTHTGLELDKRLAQEAPGLDLIIGGHDHIALAEPLKVGEVWIGQAKNRGQFLGRIDLRFEGKKVVKAAGTLIPITEELAENREVKALVSSYRTKLGQKLREVVGNTRARLDGEAEKIRRMETNLGNLVADIMRQAATTEIALVNGGTIRGSIEVGPITLEDVWRVFPYDSQLVRLELSGSQIEEVLNHSVSLGPGLTGGFLQVSGLSFVIGRSGPEDIRVHGEPLRKDRFYSVAITDFMLAGGDGYGHFKKGRSRLEHPFLIRDLFLDYLKENKEISPHIEGRIRRQP